MPHVVFKTVLPASPFVLKERVHALSGFPTWHGPIRDRGDADSGDPTDGQFKTDSTGAARSGRSVRPPRRSSATHRFGGVGRGEEISEMDEYSDHRSKLPRQVEQHTFAGFSRRACH